MTIRGNLSQSAYALLFGSWLRWDEIIKSVLILREIMQSVLSPEPNKLERLYQEKYKVIIHEWWTACTHAIKSEQFYTFDSGKNEQFGIFEGNSQGQFKVKLGISPDGKRTPATQK